MIEKLLRVFPGFGPAAQAYAFLNRALDEILFGGGRENFVEGCFRSCLIDLFHAQVALQPPPPERPLLQTQRRITLRETLVIQIAIFAQPLDHFGDDLGRSSAAREQALAQLLNRALFGCQKFRGPLEDALARVGRSERICFIRASCLLSSGSS